MRRFPAYCASPRQSTFCKARITARPNASAPTPAATGTGADETEFSSRHLGTHLGSADKSGQRTDWSEALLSYDSTSRRAIGYHRPPTDGFGAEKGNVCPGNNLPVGREEPAELVGRRPDGRRPTVRNICFYPLTGVNDPTARNANMPKRKAPNEVTSPRVASAASKLLNDPKTPPRVRSVAASALTQARNKPKGGKK